ncbi:hypothetical protein ABZY05_33420 [Streptomyces canus]|uniref:hypothetical protein n=1 Tax=Streptomyces canus TaxID=58343 RepID=UPI0033AB0D86
MCWYGEAASAQGAGSVFADSGNPYFPQKCQGHGCTAWAWNAALAFADTFHQRIGIRPVYEDARAQGRLKP